jgi:predicted component of type VI protein secretion system
MANLHQRHVSGVQVKALTMDCDHSKLNGAALGTLYWLNYLRDQAATYRGLVEKADDPLVKVELRALASVCDEIADNIEDHLTGGEDHAPRGPSRPSRKWQPN